VLGFVIPGVGELSGTARKKPCLSEVRAGFGDCGLDLLDIDRLQRSSEFNSLAREISKKLGDSYYKFQIGSGADESDIEFQKKTNAGTLNLAHLGVVVTPKLGTPVEVEPRSTVDLQARWCSSA
jgi:hypothetical protein